PEEQKDAARECDQEGGVGHRAELCEGIERLRHDGSHPAVGMEKGCFQTAKDPLAAHVRFRARIADSARRDGRAAIFRDQSDDVDVRIGRGAVSTVYCFGVRWHLYERGASSSTS